MNTSHASPHQWTTRRPGPAQLCVVMAACLPTLQSALGRPATGAAAPRLAAAAAVRQHQSRQRGMPNCASSMAFWLYSLAGVTPAVPRSPPRPFARHLPHSGGSSASACLELRLKPFRVDPHQWLVAKGAGSSGVQWRVPAAACPTPIASDCRTPPLPAAGPGIGSAPLVPPTALPPSRTHRCPCRRSPHLHMLPPLRPPPNAHHFLFECPFYNAQHTRHPKIFPTAAPPIAWLAQSRYRCHCRLPQLMLLTLTAPPRPPTPHPTVSQVLLAPWNLKCEINHAT